MNSVVAMESELAEVQEIFDAVREVCSAGVWSRGVELARADKVHGEREDADEVFFRVSTRGGMISPGVALRPAECDWECDCASRADACEHVAASVIALRRARQRGEALPRASNPSGRIRYLFSRSGGGLSFEREIVQNKQGGHGVRLETTLSAIASGRVDGPPFHTKLMIARNLTLWASGTERPELIVSANRTAVSIVVYAVSKNGALVTPPKTVYL